jgi:hypothetical protein
MKYKFKIPIGDWSDDGHGKCDEYTINCSHPVSEVRQGYKDSCKLTGISFNHNQDYTGKNLGYGSPYQIATEYESSTISEEALEILKEHKIDFDFEVEEDEEYYIEGSEEFLKLLMAFIKLSIPDLKYEITGEDLEYLNGYWNKDLNVQFGYGLFE